VSALHAISKPYSTSVSVPLYAMTARSIATPYSTSVSVPLYAITARGQLPRHIVRQFQSLYTPSPRGLSRISARQVALALASRFSRMLSFQIKTWSSLGKAPPPQPPWCSPTQPFCPPPQSKSLFSKI
jgi:hypothetical protein